MFTAQFLAALTVLLLLKGGLVVRDLLGAGFKTPSRQLAEMPLYVGNDVVGAALAAVLATLVVWPLTAAGRPRVVRGASCGLQVLHAFFAAFSTGLLLDAGGYLTRNALLATVVDQQGSALDWAPAIWDSFTQSLTFWNVAPLVVLPGVALAAGAWLPCGWARLHRWVRRPVVLLLVVLGGFALFVLPRMMRGEVGPRRYRYLNGLEKSPLPEFVASCAAPWIRAVAPGPDWTGDPFRFDFSSIVAPGQEVVTPLVGAEPRRTSLLLVIAESVGRPTLDWEENPFPYLTTLGDQPGEVAFDAHYTTWTLTTQVLFSLLCSEWPYPSYRSITMVNPAIPCRSLPETLHDAGYATAWFTSQDLNFDRQMRFLQYRRFDLVEDMHTLPGHASAWKGKWGLDDRITVQAILDWVDRQDERPFFAATLFFAAHHPWTVAPEHASERLHRVRDRQVRALGVVDDRIRDLVEGLRRLDRLDDTLVVITADHGEGCTTARARNPYEEVIRVPLVILGPQLAGVQGRVGFTTSHLDLAPTVLALLDLPIPCTMKGRDLTRPGPARVALFGGRPPRFRLGLVDAGLKYIIENDRQDWVFDVAADPGEQHDLIEDRPEFADAARERVRLAEAFSTRLVEEYQVLLDGSGCRP